MADLSCDDSTSVGTPVPQGAARRDPRRGAIPVMREPHAVFVSALDGQPSMPGEVVSGIQAAKVIIKFQKEPPCRFAKAPAGRLFYIGECYERDCKLLRYCDSASENGRWRILHKK